MNFDDETILSAYLDGELDPSHRLTVEAALLSSPRLAARLRELGRLRDAIRGLSRPAAPPDLAASVLSRIEEAEALRRSRSAARRLAFRRLALLTPFSAAAAALLIIWGQAAFRHGGPDDRPALARPTLPAAAPIVADNEPTPPRPAEPVAVSVSLLDEPDPEAERLARDEQGRFLEMLGRFEVQRFLLVVDQVDDPSLRKVEEAIGLTHRTQPRHAQLRVCQGLALDPEHPGEAVVFAVVLDDTELRKFRHNMEEQFPGSDLEAQPVGAELVAQLSESSQLRVRDGQPVGSLVDAGGHDLVTAKREPESVPKGRVADQPPVDPGGYISQGPDRPGLARPPGPIVSRGQRPHGTPADVRPDPAGPPRDIDAPAEPHGETRALYLVWVTGRDSMPRRLE